MNNSVFGKTMENIRKHRNIKLVTNREAYLKLVMEPNFKSWIRFGENLMGCEMRKIKVMNKPVYLGQAIRSQQNCNVRIPLRLHGPKIWEEIRSAIWTPTP